MVAASTSSFSSSDYNTLRTGLISLTNQFDISANDVRLSLVTFSDNPIPEFLLNSATASSWQSIQSYIQNNMQYHSFSSVSNYANALRYVADTVLTTANGKRRYVPAVVVLIVGTRSNDFTGTSQAANRLKATGAYVVTVGVGSSYDSNELLVVASSPQWVTTIPAGVNGFSQSAVTIANNVAAPNRLASE